MELMVTDTVYSPAGRPVILNSPVRPLFTVFVRPVSLFFAVMGALATRCATLSDNNPKITPAFVCCAESVETSKSKAATERVSVFRRRVEEYSRRRPKSTHSD